VFVSIGKRIEFIRSREGGDTRSAVEAAGGRAEKEAAVRKSGGAPARMNTAHESGRHGSPREIKTRT